MSLRKGDEEDEEETVLSRGIKREETYWPTSLQFSFSVAQSRCQGRYKKTL